MPEFYTKKEVRRRRVRFKAFAGLFDFAATVGSVLIVLVCVILMTSMFNWIVGDSKTTFKTVFETIEGAIITEEGAGENG